MQRQCRVRILTRVIVCKIHVSVKRINYGRLSIGDPLFVSSLLKSTSLMNRFEREGRSSIRRIQLANSLEIVGSMQVARSTIINAMHQREPWNTPNFSPRDSFMSKHRVSQRANYGARATFIVAISTSMLVHSTCGCTFRLRMFTRRRQLEEYDADGSQGNNVFCFGECRAFNFTVHLDFRRLARSLRGKRKVVISERHLLIINICGIFARCRI